MKRLAPIAAALLLLLFCNVGFAQDLPPESEESPDITVFTGDSDQEIDVSDFREPSLVRVWGYSEYLGVTDDQYNIDLFFSDTPYYGEYLLNYFIDDSSASIDVTSEGEWRIEISPVENAQVLNSPGAFVGAGNRVVILQGEPTDTVRIQTNGENSINVYGHGDEKTFLLGTEAAVDAMVQMDEPIQVITVKSEGKWTLSIGDPNAITDTITATVVATTTLAATSNPLTTTESSTLAPSFDEIRSNMEDMTDVQWDTYKKSLKGMQANEWSGWVSDVNEKFFGGYELLVDMDSPNELSVQDVTFDIPDEMALTLSKDSKVTFSGTIDSVINIFGSLQINMSDVTVTAD